MRKLTVFLAVILFAFAGGGFANAQVAITSDILNIAHLTQLIDQIYATYDHIMTTVEQVQNTYQQLQKQYDMVMTMPEKINSYKDNLGDIDLTNPEGFLRFRDQYKDTVTFINYNMDLVNNIYDTFTKKKINFGGKNYTFGGIFGMPGASKGTTIFDLPRNIVEYAGAQMEEGAAGYTGKLTREQEEAIMRKYGLSPRNYYKLRFVEETVALPIDAIIGEATPEAWGLRAGAHALKNQYIQDLAAIGGDSLVAQMNTLTEGILGLGDSIFELGETSKKALSFSAQMQFRQDTLKEAQAEQQLDWARKMIQEEQFRYSAVEFGNW
jgi:uncharacterized protein YoxC